MNDHGLNLSRFVGLEGSKQGLRFADSGDLCFTPFSAQDATLGRDKKDYPQMTLFNVAHARRLVSGFHPDPTICRTPQGTYYMVNSSFEYFPGLPVFESADGEQWRHIGDAIDRESQFPYESMANSQGIYAPTLRYHDGLYYLIVTNVNAGNMILTTDDPHHGWSEPIWIQGWPGIDPSLFFDDDGTVYICGNEGSEPDSEGNREQAGIYLSTIDVATGTVLGKRQRICAGVTGSNPEGPHLYKRDGTYYLMWAEGGTEAGHMENIARASSPTGPYEMYPANPLITNRSTHLTLQAIGHCDCACFDADRTLMVFHGTRNNDEYPAQGWIGREPYGVWFGWKNDWPDLADQSYDCPLNGDGNAWKAGISWITPGIDEAHRYTVRDDGRHIMVEASESDFFPASGAPMIGIRQTDFHCEFAASVADPARLVRGEAGIVVYANANHYMTVAMHVAQDGGIAVEAAVHNAGLVSTVGCVHVPVGAAGHDPIRLSVYGDESGYRFAAVLPAVGHVDEIPLGAAPGKVLGFANAGGFTGVVLGVYAHGMGTIEFDDVRYRTGDDADGNASSACSI